MSEDSDKFPLYLYNLFLKYGIRRGKPFRPKQQFVPQKEDDKKVIWQRVAEYFYRYDYIIPEEFFDVVYARTSPVTEITNPLAIFSQKNIAIYIRYKKGQRFLPLKDQKEIIRKGFLFLIQFCRKQNLKSWEEYLQYGEITPAWLQHYREFRVSPYNLLLLPNFLSIYLPKLAEIEDTGLSAGVTHDLILFNKKMSGFFEKPKLLYLVSKLEQNL